MIFAATPLSLSPKSVNCRQGEPQLTDQIGYAVGVPLNERHFRGEIGLGFTQSAEA
jgi:hypothetical protein